MKYAELAEKLTALGMRRIDQTCLGQKWVDPASGASVAIADEGELEMNIGIINHVLTALQLSMKEISEV